MNLNNFSFSKQVKARQQYGKLSIFLDIKITYDIKINHRLKQYPQIYIHVVFYQLKRFIKLFFQYFKTKLSSQLI